MQIISNGSKWMGEQPDGLDELLEVLSTHPLDPTFEEYGDFFYFPEYGDNREVPANTRLASGNFYDISHVFNIEGTTEELEPLRLAILANKQSDAYQQAKREMAERKQAEQEARTAAYRLHQEQEIENARAVLRRAEMV